MVFVLIALWTISAILLIVNPKNESTRWAALTAFAGGGGGLSRAVTETILPYLDQHQISTPAFDSFLFKLHLFGSFMNHTGLPYCFIMFAISYSGLFRRNVKSFFAWILPVPIFVMLLITPFSPDIQLNFQALFLWCVPYLIIGIVLLSYSLIKETNAKRRRSRMFSNLVAFPPILFKIVANYTLKAFFDVQEVWRYMPFVITLLLVSFLLLGAKFGVLGVRLKFEKDRLDGTMRAVSYGTSVLNHTIKNEVGKIKIVADEIRSLASTMQHEKIVSDAGMVLDSTNHMLEMVTRIQNRTQEIIMKEGLHDVTKILDRTLNMSRLMLEERNIKINTLYNASVVLVCDPVHLQEAFYNIILNAVEAMENGGTLSIAINEARKHSMIEFKDSGKGISKEDIPYVFDPFYSTKHRNRNFGLGLTYCYNVMQQHGGSMELTSESNVGTTVVFQFPKKRNQSHLFPVTGGMDIGQDQTHAG